MKLKEKIKNEQGLVLIDGLRNVIKDSVSKLKGFEYSDCDHDLNDVYKKITLIVEYYIMFLYRDEEIDSITYEELLNNIHLVLSMIEDLDIYNKRYIDALWWAIYRLFDAGAELSISFTSDLALRLFEMINNIEIGEYPMSYLDLLDTNELEECINEMYLTLMSDFVFGKKI